MDKLKFTIIPDCKELRNIIIYTLSVVTVLFIIVNIFSCTDDIFIMGYNKDLEELHQSMFEADSLIRTINMELDSLNKKY